MRLVPNVVSRRYRFQLTVMWIYFFIVSILQTAIVDARQSEEHLEIYKNTIESLYSPSLRKTSEEFSRRFFSLIHMPTPDRISFKSIMWESDEEFTKSYLQEMREMMQTAKIRGLKFPIFDIGAYKSASRFFREQNKVAIDEYVKLLCSVDTQSSLSRPRLIRTRDPEFESEEEWEEGLMLQPNLGGSNIRTLIPALQIAALSVDADYGRTELLKAIYNTGLLLMDSHYSDHRSYGHSGAVSSLVIARYLHNTNLLNNDQLSQFLDHVKQMNPRHSVIVFDESLEIERLLARVRLEKLFAGDFKSGNLNVEDYILMSGVKFHQVGLRGQNFHFNIDGLVELFERQNCLKNCNKEEVLQRVDDFFSVARNRLRLDDLDSIQNSLDNFVWHKDEFNAEDWLVALATDKTRAFLVNRAKVYEEQSLALQASVDITELILLSRQFFEQNDRFPESQTDLLARTVDPFSGEDYRFKIEGDSLIIYSVGWKGIDNGGQIDHEAEFKFSYLYVYPTDSGQPEHEKFDIGWKLTPDR